MLKTVVAALILLAPLPAFALTHELLNEITTNSNPTSRTPVHRKKIQTPDQNTDRIKPHHRRH